MILREPGPEIEDMPLGLLSDPLAWFFAEHFRHRQLCRAIEEIAASGTLQTERIAKVVDFLRFDLPLHVIDEEEDLFPLLRRRSLPEDEIQEVLGVLSAEHKEDVDQARQVRLMLEACLADRSLPSAEATKRAMLIEFARQERNHLALENAVVLPIAKLRLSQDDLQEISRRLAARRGRLLSDSET